MKRCSRCGEEFPVSSHPNKIFCSRRCKEAMHKRIYNKKNRKKINIKRHLKLIEKGTSKKDLINSAKRSLGIKGINLKDNPFFEKLIYIKLKINELKNHQERGHTIMITNQKSVNELDKIITELFKNTISDHHAQILINAIDKKIKAFAQYLIACKENGLQPDLSLFDLKK
jgi:hypothetical protein